MQVGSFLDLCIWVTVSVSCLLKLFTVLVWMWGIPRTNKLRARDGKGTVCLELARHGLCLPKGVIRASWSRTQKHRRKRAMRICCKQRLQANSSCICDRVRFLRRRLHSRWGTTIWTRDPLRSQPHKRYTDLCQSYTYLWYDDNLWYEAPAPIWLDTARMYLFLRIVRYGE